MEIEITVIESGTGAPLPGVEVSIVNDVTGLQSSRYTDGGGYTNHNLAGVAGDFCTITTSGYQFTASSASAPEGPFYYRLTSAADQKITLTVQKSFRRPAAIPHSPLPAFDPSDSGGQVHTTPPPELVIPSGPDPLFMRADFNGVTLDADRWGGLQKFKDAFLHGANTTPYTMIMTPMCLMYPRWLQDATLTEHAERGYSHFVIAPDGWNMPENGFSPTPGQYADWARYVKSWGFYVTHWRSDPLMDDPFLHALVDAHAVDFVIPAEEVDRKMPAPSLAALLNNTLGIVSSGIPIGTHTTNNFPEGFPRDTFFDGRSMPSFADYNGLVHFCWQADQNESAGTQAARCYYARQRVNLGAVGGDGRLAPDSRVFAFETMASDQLIGKCTEEYGNLRSLELLYATRTDDRIRPMSGFGNGCRYPNGDPL